MITNLEQLVSKARSIKNITAGVPCPEDDSTILSVIQAKQQNLADFILCGAAARIKELLRQHGASPADFEIFDCPGAEAAVARIVALGREKKLQLILKGFLPTAALMKPILDKEKGLRGPNLLSDILVVENPASGADGLLGMSDGGLNILPDLSQKKQILENAVAVFHCLGYAEPKVGVMAAIETVKDSMPATLDARALTEMNQRGEIGGCRVYGPLALDIAVSPQAAEHKGVVNDVAGHTQIMIVPNIESGNLLGKAFTYYLKLTVAHVVMGAQLPILIPSRNESDTDKFHSLALGVLSAAS
ncbi:MAG: phosphate butyryltransferase [Acidobacteria bacterium]|nr:phosphate butyryltransferase [Acidobacteriota bacterium]MBU4307889.1 phosphate butyryltransferase [Acidobacteriota bacterium]MBU4405177.1 phosphate butyryltransferase [Acidobacteriota bacterium]MCG2811027.1 phosphate butyryltransferase [Candidatus Aminicenantes bacterium]